MIPMILCLALVGPADPPAPVRFDPNSRTILLRAGDGRHRREFHGVLLRADRILKIRHAQADARRVDYWTEAGWRRCRVLRADPKCDLALLAAPTGSALRLWPATGPVAPDDPLVIGGLGLTLSQRGPVVATRRERAGEFHARVVELDLRTLRGDSGLPVFDAAHDLAGVVTSSDDPLVTRVIDSTEIRYFLEMR